MKIGKYYKSGLFVFINREPLVKHLRAPHCVYGKIQRKAWLLLDGEISDFFAYLYFLSF